MEKGKQDSSGGGVGEGARQSIYRPSSSPQGVDIFSNAEITRYRDNTHILYTKNSADLRVITDNHKTDNGIITKLRIDIENVLDIDRTWNKKIWFFY